MAPHLQHAVVRQQLRAQRGRGAQEAAVVHLHHRLPDGQHLRPAQACMHSVCTGYPTFSLSSLRSLCFPPEEPCLACNSAVTQ
jgi:hypothetical protein